MSLMSGAATAIYGLVLLACLAAALVARNYPDRPGDAPHWLLAGSVFIGLAAMRLFNGEDSIRNLARGLTRGTGDYADRLVVQIPLAIGVFVLGCWLAFVFVRKWRSMRRGSRARLVLVSRFGLLALVPLYALRLISLHQTDWLLYTGPIRLNWVFEGLICATVGGTATLYRWARRPRVNPDREPRDRR